MDELRCRYVLRLAVSLEDSSETLTQASLHVDLLLEPVDMVLDRLFEREVRSVQALANLLEGKPELPQGQDVLQSADVLRPLQPVTGGRMLTRGQQADLVVIVQGANRQSGCLGQLPYAEGFALLRVCHGKKCTA